MTRMTKARLRNQTADLHGSKSQLYRKLTLADTSSVPKVVTRYGTLVGSCRSPLHLGRRWWIRDGRADFFHGQQTLLFYVLG